jgi:hypothetical protein
MLLRYRTIRDGEVVRGKECKGRLYTRNKRGAVVQKRCKFLVTDDPRRRNKYPQDACQCQWRLVLLLAFVWAPAGSVHGILCREHCAKHRPDYSDVQ